MLRVRELRARDRRVERRTGERPAALHEVGEAVALSWRLAALVGSPTCVRKKAEA